MEKKAAKAELATPGKIVVISGGTAGIGLELAKSLYQQDWKVAVFGRDPKKVEEARRAFPDEGRFIADAFSVDDFVKTQAFLDRVESVFGSVPRYLVNNAGVTGPMVPISEMAPEQVSHMIGTNLIGTITLTSAVLVRMHRAGIHGVIVNVSSGSAVGLPGLATYAASKAGVNVFTSAVAQENEKHGIKIFSLNPGHVDTRLQADARAADHSKFPAGAHFANLKDKNLLVRPEDSARHIGYLLQHPEEFTPGTVVDYLDIEAKLPSDPGAGILDPAEVSTARKALERRFGEDLRSGKIWQKMPVIEINGKKISPSKDLKDYGRYLNEIHQRIATSPGKTAAISIASKIYIVIKKPIGEGMAAIVYSLANMDKVIKITKPLLLEVAIQSALVESDRAAALAELMAKEIFLTPSTLESSPFGTFNIRERVKGEPLTRLLIREGVIKLQKDSSGNKFAVLAPPEELTRLLASPLIRDVERHVEQLINLRRKNPSLIQDLGPDNLVTVYQEDAKAPRLKGLSLVDTGFTSVKSNQRMDKVQNFSDYLGLSEILVNRYLKTGVFNQGESVEPPHSEPFDLGAFFMATNQGLTSNIRSPLFTAGSSEANLVISS